mgnify:CR=1 FL=1
MVTGVFMQVESISDLNFGLAALLLHGVLFPFWFKLMMFFADYPKKLKVFG